MIDPSLLPPRDALPKGNSPASPPGERGFCLSSIDAVALETTHRFLPEGRDMARTRATDMGAAVLKDVEAQVARVRLSRSVPAKAKTGALTGRGTANSRSNARPAPFKTPKRGNDPARWQCAAREPVLPKPGSFAGAGEPGRGNSETPAPNFLK